MAWRYFVLYKPFGYLSQFTPEQPGQLTLAELGPFPPDVYPVGRLDHDSEGLLLLTNNRRLNHQLLNPQQAHWRTYWVQVEGQPDTLALQALAQGVEIRINKQTVLTQPAQVRHLAEAPPLPARVPPIRVRRQIPDSWLELRLREGKNRQVRRMCAKVGYPVLRLVRSAIGNLTLGDLQPGEVRELSELPFAQELYK